MTVTLHVIVDQLLAPVPGGIGRYTEELTRELIATAPAGCDVEGIVSLSPQPDLDRVKTLLPGLAGLTKVLLPRRELSLAWQYGLSRLPGRGMVHSTSVLAPLNRHDRVNSPGEQTVVTIHDVVPWTHPDTLTPRGVSWHKAMVKRAHKYADAVVVPTHAVAAQLNEFVDFGDRVRVIGGAVSNKLAIPVDADDRAARLGLPERYLLAVGTLEPRKGLVPLIESLALPGSTDLPLVIAGPEGWGGIDVQAIASELGLAPDRVRTLGYLTDADLAVAIDRATVFVFPSLAEGFGLPVIEAFSLGTPVVHSDAPAVLEVSGGAGLSVATDAPIGYAQRLAEAVASVVDDADLARQLSFAGLDRSRIFSWRRSAEQVWQLHADL